VPRVSLSQNISPSLSSLVFAGFPTSPPSRGSPSAETGTPVRASSSQFVGGDARRLPPCPPLPVYHYRGTLDGGITTATILHQNKFPPSHEWPAEL